MDDHARLARAEAEFREAVQREQSALMASGVSRSEATEILLRRLRGGKHPRASSFDASFPSPPGSPPEIPSSEFLTLVNVHGYSAEDAERALTICHEIRLLQAAGIGGVAAAEELTRRVLRGDRNSAAESAGGRVGAEASHAGGSAQERDDVVSGQQQIGAAGVGACCGGRRQGRAGGWNNNTQVRSIRGDGGALVDSNSTSAPTMFSLPPAPAPAPAPWEQPLQEWGNRSPKGVSNGIEGGISGESAMAAGCEHVPGCSATRQEGGPPGVQVDSKGSMVVVSPPNPGGRSPRVINGNGGSRKRGHASTMQHCGGVVGQGSFPPPSPHGVFAGSMSCASASSSSVSLHRGTDGMTKGFDGMDVSGALVSPPLAKRPRFHGSGGVEEGSSGDERGHVGRKEPRQLVLVGQDTGKEDQEQQLQHAFHQLGVRQKNTPPSPPLMSVVPPKRPRNPSDDSSSSANGKRPRND